MSVPSLLARGARRSFPVVSKPLRILPSRRAIHLPPLTNVNQYSENGIAGVFSQKAFDTNWTKYQSHLINNLNRLTAGQADLENLSPLDLAVLTARQSDQAAIFNYASQAYNNHFFFEGLTTSQTQIHEALHWYISHSFSSPEALKTEFLATANAMFGNGWVWLILDSKRYIRILCTYNAGTPFGSGHRRQDIDMNTKERLGTSVEELTAATQEATKGPMNHWAIPLLNIKVWEHAWVEDYGVTGKREYLENVWSAINWDVVNSRAPALRAQTTRSAV